MASDTSARAQLVTSLRVLFAAHAAQHRAFSAWESHCLGAAITLLRIGEYERARQCLADLEKPPPGFPTFALPRSLSLEDVQRAISLVANNARPASSIGD
jgi:hypothetical protein